MGFTGITGSQPSSGAAGEQLCPIRNNSSYTKGRVCLLFQDRLLQAGICLDSHGSLCFYCINSNRTLWMLLHPNQEHRFGYRNITALLIKKKPNFFLPTSPKSIREKTIPIKVSGINSFMPLEVLISLWELPPKTPKWSFLKPADFK